jgi:Na+/H+ antiporter NhaD/arsenite permease-like protein
MQLYALLVFVFTYVLIAGPRVPILSLDRPTGALLGASLMVLGGVMSTAEALAAIDLRTIAILFGMLCISGYFSEAGAFSALAVKLSFLQSRPKQLLIWLVLGSGALSALLLNDTVCLMLVPLLVALIKAAKLPPKPYLFALAISANVGGVVTFTGNPQNMIIGARANISYADYSLNMMPIGIVSLGVTIVMLLWFFQRDLRPPSEPPTETPMPTIDWVLLYKAAAVMALVMLAFLLGYDQAGVAMLGASVLITIAKRPPRTFLARIDWPLLLFFAALFVVVHGVEASGATRAAAVWIVGLLEQPSVISVPLFAGASLVGSNIFSNVPFVLVVSGWLEQAPNADIYWRTLAMSATFAGNLTLLGSVANLIVFEGGKEVAEVSFWEYLRVGLPITLVTTAIGVLGILLING